MPNGPSLEPIPQDSSDRKFELSQKLGLGVLVVTDPGEIEPIDYPPLPPAEQALLPELARRAHLSRIQYDSDHQ